MKEVNTCKNIIGNGTRYGTSRVRMTIARSSPIMFPKRRKLRERIRLKWPINSMGSMSGMSQGTGPEEMLHIMRAVLFDSNRSG